MLLSLLLIGGATTVVTAGSFVATNVAGQKGVQKAIDNLPEGTEQAEIDAVAVEASTKNAIRSIVVSSVAGGLVAAGVSALFMGNDDCSEDEESDEE